MSGVPQLFGDRSHRNMCSLVCIERGKNATQLATIPRLPARLARLCEGGLIAKIMDAPGRRRSVPKVRVLYLK